MIFVSLGRLEACPTRTLAEREATLLEQFLDDLAAVGDLHRAAVLAGEGGFQRDAEGLADGSHHPPGFPSQAAQLCYGAFSSTKVQGQ